MNISTVCLRKNSKELRDKIESLGIECWDSGIGVGKTEDYPFLVVDKVGNPERKVYYGVDEGYFEGCFNPFELMDCLQDENMFFYIANKI